MNGFIRNTRLFALFAVLLIVAAPAFAQNRIQPGPYGVLFRSSTAADTITLTTNQMVGLLTGTPTAAANYTTPTATQICASLPLIAQQSQGTNNNFAVLWIIKNTSAGANTITVVAGAGVTATGTMTIAQNAARPFWIVPTSCTGTPAVTVFSLGTLGAF